VLVLWESPGGPPRRAAALLVGTFGGGVGWGVTGGRHFAAMPLRVGFVLVLGAIGLAASYVLSPSIRRAVARWPERTALGAGGLALAAELANHLVLPRLYPAFHFGLAALTAMTAPFLGRG